MCFVDPDLMAFRARMVQRELVVGVVSCPGADGNPKLKAQYSAFTAKFTPELTSNAKDLKSIVARKGHNFDVVITEIANRTAQQPRWAAATCRSIRMRRITASNGSFGHSTPSFWNVSRPISQGSKGSRRQVRRLPS